MTFRVARFLTAAVLVLTCALAGCATPGNTEPSAPETDPWEGLNRSLYTLNDTVDRYSLKPIAKGYRAVLPQFMRTGVSNFSNNLRTPSSSLNNLLQGKPTRAASDLARFLLNTTIGIGGLFDVAIHAGLERYDEDFGQTLAVWGVPDGPFVIVPFLGPATLRDAVAIPVNLYTDMLRQVDDSSIRDKLWALRVIDLRYRLLSADRFLEESEDPYITLRESYLQNRRYEIYDGSPPLDDELYDDFGDFDDFDDLDDLGVLDDPDAAEGATSGDN